jgi:hypothetical protein
MRVSMSEIAPPVFLSTMENVVPTQHVRAGPPGFLTDLPTFDSFSLVPPVENTMNVEPSPKSHSSSASPPQSQIPSPSIHGAASSYSQGVTSSLESALEQPVVATHHRSRGNTSVSPATIPASFLAASPPGHQPIGMTFPAPEATGIAGKQDPSEAKTQLILVDMLSE